MRRVVAELHEWFLDKCLEDMEMNGGMLESDYDSIEYPKWNMDMDSDNVTEDYRVLHTKWSELRRKLEG